MPKEPEQVAFVAQYCVTQGRGDRAWTNSLLTQAHYPDRAKLLQELFPDRPRRTEVPRVYQNLPPRYGDFLGRQIDMDRVQEGLASRWPLISIEGLGGVGKTTLAIDTARRCLPGSDTTLDLPFEVVVWVSAKNKPEQKRWLNEVSNTVAQVLDYPYITQLETIGQKETEVDQLLRSHRTLVIVDKLETIEDPDLVAWMQRIPKPSKVLITSRHAQLRTVWATHPRGLGEPEALELIRRHARRLGLRTIEPAEGSTLLPLAQVTEGNPKAIEVALGYVKYGSLGLSEVVDHLHAASKTVQGLFEDLFARTWGTLKEDARHVLLAVPFIVEAAVKEALGAAAGLKGFRLDMALGQLTEMSLSDAGQELGRSPATPLTLSGQTAHRLLPTLLRPIGRSRRPHRPGLGLSQPGLRSLLPPGHEPGRGRDNRVDRATEGDICTRGRPTRTRAASQSPDLRAGIPKNSHALPCN